MNNIRVWLFRGLVIIAGGLLVISWSMPWWSCDILAVKLSNAIIIHPYGLEVNMGAYASYFEEMGIVMPGWFAPFMWTYWD
jgi:hypothetical protein